uniref:SAM domain-containing protein n=1 Tax=Sphaeramia orbicularis TaxID=375764 RepID=A0A673B2W0_9TELE
QQQQEEQEEEEEEEEEGEEEEEEEDTPPVDTVWAETRQYFFLLSSAGGQDIAQEFRSQEIDGQALLLLTEDHLVSTMNLKLGPALKLCAHINSLKDTHLHSSI